MQINEKDKRALGLCGIFLVVVVVYFGMVDPYVLRYDSAVENISNYEKELDKLNRKKKLLRPRQRKLKTTRAEVEKMRELFGGDVKPEKRLGVSIADFQQAAAAAGVNLHSYRPLPTTEQRHPDFEEFRFELDFSGGYYSVMRMLHRLEAGSNLLETLQLDLKQDKDRVRCRMMVVRSFIRGEGEVSLDSIKEQIGKSE